MFIMKTAHCSYLVKDIACQLYYPINQKNTLPLWVLKPKMIRLMPKRSAVWGQSRPWTRGRQWGEFFYHLRSLSRHNQSLKEMWTTFNNQVEATENCMYVDKVSIRSLGKLIKTLDIQIQENTEAITTHVNSNEPIAKKIENITAIKGVGILTVAVILGETNGFELFKSIAQLVSYSGYDVVENQSGSHTGKTKISKVIQGSVGHYTCHPYVW